jgi:hypothetical protein
MLPGKIGICFGGGSNTRCGPLTMRTAGLPLGTADRHDVPKLRRTACRKLPKRIYTSVLDSRGSRRWRMGDRILGAAHPQGATEWGRGAAFRARPRSPATRSGSIACTGRLLAACIYRQSSTPGGMPLGRDEEAGRRDAAVRPSLPAVGVKRTVTLLRDTLGRTAGTFSAIFLAHSGSTRGCASAGVSEELE